MELEAKRRHLPFFTGMAQLKQKWDIYVSTEDYLEIAYPIWRTLGNIATERQTISAEVPSDGIIQLPVSCEFVKSVTTTDLINEDGTTNDPYDFTNSSAGKVANTSPDKSVLSKTSNAGISADYSPGHDVNWNLGDGVINITSPEMEGRTVRILYEFISTDDDGLPLLNDKELEAILFNVALVLSERDLFRKVPGADKVVAYLKPEAVRTLVAAKIPEQISDAVLNKALDIQTSRGFKTHGDKLNFS